MKSWRSKATIWNHNKGFTESYCIKLDVDRSHENTAMYRRIVPSVLEWMRWVTIKISIQWRLHNGISLSQWWRRQRRCAAMTTGINRAAWRHRRHLPAQRPQCYPPQRPLLITGGTCLHKDHSAIHHNSHYYIDDICYLQYTWVTETEEHEDQDSRQNLYTKWIAAKYQKWLKLWLSPSGTLDYHKISSMICTILAITTLSNRECTWYTWTNKHVNLSVGEMIPEFTMKLDLQDLQQLLLFMTHSMQRSSYNCRRLAKAHLTF